jgi:hypothetical protein
VLGLSLFQIHGCGSDDADGGIPKLSSTKVEGAQSGVMTCMLEVEKELDDAMTKNMIRRDMQADFDAAMQEASCNMLVGIAACYESYGCDKTFEQIGQDCGPESGKATAPQCDTTVKVFLDGLEDAVKGTCPDTDLKNHC